MIIFSLIEYYNVDVSVLYYFFDPCLFFRLVDDGWFILNFL
jgi:hypothetical protein